MVQTNVTDLFFFTHGTVISFDENNTEVFIWRNIVDKSFYFACFGLVLIPERNPVNIISVTQFFIQQIHKWLVDIQLTRLFGSDDMRIGGMPEYIMNEVIAT